MLQFLLKENNSFYLHLVSSECKFRTLNVHTWSGLYWSLKANCKALGHICNCTHSTFHTLYQLKVYTSSYLIPSCLQPRRKLQEQMFNPAVTHSSHLNPIETTFLLILSFPFGYISVCATVSCWARAGLAVYSCHMLPAAELRATAGSVS